MSNDFRKYIVENEKLQFNNPFTEKQSIQGLQRYLNKNIKVSDISDSPINYDKKLQKMSLNNESTENKINLKRIEKNKNNKDSKIILHKNILKKFTFKNKSLSSKNIFSSTKNSENSDSKKNDNEKTGEEVYGHSDFIRSYKNNLGLLIFHLFLIILIH